MALVYSDGRCIGIDVSIGQMLLDPPPLGTSVATVHEGRAGFAQARPMDEEERRIAHRQRQEEWMLRNAEDLEEYAEVRRLARADGVGWAGW